MFKDDLSNRGSTLIHRKVRGLVYRICFRKLSHSVVSFRLYARFFQPRKRSLIRIIIRSYLSEHIENSILLFYNTAILPQSQAFFAYVRQ